MEDNHAEENKSNQESSMKKPLEVSLYYYYLLTEQIDMFDDMPR